MKTLHNLIMVQWEKDFGSIHNEHPMDAYTVSGFIKSILREHEGKVQFKEPPAEVKEETQEELWDELGNFVNSYNPPEDGIGFHALTCILKNHWTITRKRD